MFYASLGPLPPQPDVPSADKYEHIFAYFVLMLWFAQLYRGVPARLSVAAALVAMGVGIEFLQALTPHRKFEYADMVADATGVAIGWVLGATLLGGALALLERRFLPRAAP